MSSSRRDSNMSDLAYHDEDEEQHETLLEHLFAVGDLVRPYVKLTSTERNRRNSNTGSTRSNVDGGQIDHGEFLLRDPVEEQRMLVNPAESQGGSVEGASKPPSIKKFFKNQFKNQLQKANTAIAANYGPGSRSSSRNSADFSLSSSRSRANTAIQEATSGQETNENPGGEDDTQSQESSSIDLSGSGQVNVTDHEEVQPGDAYVTDGLKPDPITPSIEPERVQKNHRTPEEQIAYRRELQARLVGWHQIGGWDNPLRKESSSENEDLLQRRTFLESYISEKFLGDWYQNTILIVMSTAAGWLLGHIGLGVSSISVILIFTATAYRSSLRRVRRNCRDDLVRVQALRKLGNDTETMEWLNSFVTKFWLIYEPTLSMTIAQIANEVLDEQKPSFIDRIQLDQFTLGSKAPRIDFIRSSPKTDPLEAVVDVAASFTPNDTADLTARQLQTKVNPKVKLGVRIGKRFLAKKFPILLEDMSFKGEMRFRINMFHSFPHIKTLEFCFLDPPEFDFVLKPIGGETFGFDIKIIPGLSSFIKELVDSNLGPLVYSPNTFQLNVQQLIAGVGVMSGVGVVSLRIKAARDLLGDSGDSINGYVRLINKDKKEIARTSVKSNSSSPVWEEHMYAIVTNLSEAFVLEVCNFQDSGVDYAIGSTSFSIDELPPDTEKHTLFNGGRPRGDLEFLARFSEVQMAHDQHEFHARRSGDIKSGILLLSVIGGRDLVSTSSKTASLSPFCDIELNGKLIDSTKTTSSSSSPEWNHRNEYVIHSKTDSQVVFRIRNGRTRLSPTIGLFKTSLMSLLTSNERNIEIFPLENDAGSICIQTQWKPVSILGADSDLYVEPIGVIRLGIYSAEDYPEKGHTLRPYCSVKIGEDEVFRTARTQSERQAVWDETIYLPIQTELQTMTFELMNRRKRGQDLNLGSFQVRLSSIIDKDEFGNYKPFSSSQRFASKLYTPGAGFKGLLRYSIEYFPSIRIASPSQRKSMAKEKKVIDSIRQKALEENGLSDSLREELKLREDRLILAAVDMPLEEQLQYDKGVFSFSILSAKNVEDGMRLAILANNHPDPVYFSAPAVKSTLKIEGSTGDFVSTQLHLSSIRLAICETEDGRNPAYERTLGCFELMKMAFERPRVFDLGGPLIELQVRMFPIPDLAPAEEFEDISNDGGIVVELLRGEDLPAADRSGLSDPYVKFHLSGDKDSLYVSEVEKSTLNPVWNEKFRFDVSDVTRCALKALVYDWDLGSRDDLLGGFQFNLGELEPLVWKEYDVELRYVKRKHQAMQSARKSGGKLRLRLKFAPGFLAKEKGSELVGSKSVSKVSSGARRRARGPNYIGADKTERYYKIHIKQTSFDQLKEYAKEVQIRGYTLEGRETEVFRSRTLKIGDEYDDIDASFQVVGNQTNSIGIKVLSVKAFGLHKDIGQAAARLDPGEHRVNLGGGSSLLLSISPGAMTEERSKN